MVLLAITASDMWGKTMSSTFKEEVESGLSMRQVAISEYWASKFSQVPFTLFQFHSSPRLPTPNFQLPIHVPTSTVTTKFHNPLLSDNCCYLDE